MRDLSDIAADHDDGECLSQSTGNREEATGSDSLTGSGDDDTQDRRRTPHSKGGSTL